MPASDDDAPALHDPDPAPWRQGQPLPAPRMPRCGQRAGDPGSAPLVRSPSTAETPLPKMTAASPPRMIPRAPIAAALKPTTPAPPTARPCAAGAPGA